jgi:hypothetical protein
MGKNMQNKFGKRKMKISKWARIMRKPVKRIDRFFHHLFSIESDPLSNPLSGDRCIEYAFVIGNIKELDRKSKVLDVGCAGSPSTTIIRSLGFEDVTGIDINKSPVKYKDVKFLSDDICTAKLPRGFYDIIIFCSTIEHIGLAGRYGSPNISDGDIKALKMAEKLLSPNRGKLILTIPYGIPTIVRPYHRVYNCDSIFMKYMLKEFDIVKEEYYKNNSENVWEICPENEAAKVIPTKDNYALGLFVLSLKLSKKLQKQELYTKVT